MALPSPSQLEDEVKEIREGLSRLLDDYKWGFGMLYGVKTSQPESTDTKLGTGKAMPARGDIAFSDPTGNAAVDKERVRSNMGQAAGSLQRIRRQMESGLEALGRIFSDRRDRYERPPDELGKKRILSRADLAASHEAKRKRESEGVGFGEG